MASSVIDFLLTRRSAPIHEMTGPGPTQAEIETMIRAAVRVPDHGRLEPWRFVLYRGEGAAAIGEALATLAGEREGPLPEARLQQERTRFTRAPLVVGVVSVPRESIKIPQWEMLLSGAMAAMNLIHAAHALGYRANMVTNWYSDLAEGRRLLGLAPAERVVGFVHVGRHHGDVPDRPRPDPAAVVSEYRGPFEAG